MKTHVLILSKKFPGDHKKAGKPTRFFELISVAQKIHTIRANYDFWENRINEINKGNAILSVRSWTGRPYKSKQKEHFKLGKGEVGIEGLVFRNDNILEPIATKKNIDFSNVKSSIQEILLYNLAKNDGLLTPDFKEWFKNYDLSGDMAIIHFTNFRYVL